jgi:hypothetical protein
MEMQYHYFTSKLERKTERQILKQNYRLDKLLLKLKYQTRETPIRAFFLMRGRRILSDYSGDSTSWREYIQKFNQEWGAEL